MVKLKEEKPVFEDILARMEKLCIDLQTSENWSLQTDAESIKKDLTEVFLTCKLIGEMI